MKLSHDLIFCLWFKFLQSEFVKDRDWLFLLMSHVDGVDLAEGDRAWIIVTAKLYSTTRRYSLIYKDVATLSFV